MMTWEAVCEFLKELPGAELDPLGGRDGVRVRGKVVAFPARSGRCRPATAIRWQEEPRRARRGTVALPTGGFYVGSQVGRPDTELELKRAELLTGPGEPFREHWHL
jgi:hypothetical protein